MRNKKKMPDGGPIKSFYEDYLHSPNYLKRLKATGYTDPQKTIREREKQLKETSVQITNDRDTRFRNGKISYDPNQIALSKSNPTSVLAHEYSHASGSMLNMGINSNFVLNPIEQTLINQANQLYKVDDSKMNIDEKISLDHDKFPSEAKANMDALRFALKRDKIYDTGTQEFTPELLKKAKQKYKSDNILNRNFKDFKDEDFIYLMNNIASNNSSESSTAENGISMAKKNVHPLLSEILAPLGESGIHINPANKGKFNATKKKTGKSTEELTHSSNPVTKKRAIFAQNAAKWHHGDDGLTISKPYTQRNAGVQDNTDLSRTEKKNDYDNLPADQQQYINDTPADLSPKKSQTNWGNVALGTMTAIDALLPYGRINRNQVVQPPQAYNPYQYGTGSSAIMEDGGIVQFGGYRPQPKRGDFDLDDTANKMVLEDGGYIKKLNSNGKVIPNIMKNGGKMEGPYTRKTMKANSGANIIADGLGGKGKKVRPKYLDSFNDNMLLTAEYADGGEIPPVKKGVAQMTDQEVHNELNQPRTIPGDLIKVEDNRTKHPVTGARMQKGHNSTYVNSDIIKSITAQAKAKGVNPNDALAISLQESEFGNANKHNTQKMSPEIQNFEYESRMQDLGQAHAYLPDDNLTNPIDQGASSLAKALKEKNAYAAQLGLDKQGDAYRLQTYNGLGKIGTGGKARDRVYGIDIDKDHPLDMRQNPAYGKTVVDLRNQVIQTNPAIEDIVNKTPAYKSTMENGGGVRVNKIIPNSPFQFKYGGGMEPISMNPYSGPTFEFKGPSHEDGGIGMSYGGKNVEVEGQETGFIDQEGTLNVMGNMVFPGTNTKFKSLSKKIAKQENGANKKFVKGQNLMNDSDPDDSFDYLRFNSGRALTIGADMRMKALSTSKEKLSQIQKSILESADNLGADPQEFAKGKFKKATYGASLTGASGIALDDPGKPTRSDRNHNPGNLKYGTWAKTHGATGKDKDGFAIFPDNNVGLGAMKNLLKSKGYADLSVKDAINKWTDNKPYNYDLGDIATKKVSSLQGADFDKVINTMRSGEGTNYGPQLADTKPKSPVPGVTIPDIATGKGKINLNSNIPASDRFRGDYTQVEGDNTPLPDLNPRTKNIQSSSRFNKLGIDQLLPEIYSVATNQEVPVPAQKFQPTLYQPYQVSFQDRIEDNERTFNGIAKQNNYNPEVLSSLGAQKYAADNAVKAEEFRTNQGISNDVTNKNISILNDAQKLNLQLADQQMVRQATARSKTKSQNQEALNSVASKILQNNLENIRLKTYEPLFDYRYQDTDNNGTIDQMGYEGDPASFNFSGASKGGNGAGDARTKLIYDKNGSIKETQKTYVPQMDEDLKALKLYQQRRKTFQPPR